MTEPRPRQPLVLDDYWEPPARPRSNRWRLIAASIITVCVAFVVIRAAVPEPDQARSLDLGLYTRPWNLDLSRPALEYPVTPAPAAAPTLTAVGATRARRTAPPPPVPTASRRAGYLWINSQPWAELSVDGNVIGNTPQLRLRVTPGRHQLVFVRSGFETQRTWVTVEPGATLRITDIALRRSTP